MKDAIDVLTALARTVSAFAAYAHGHPSRERALDALSEALARLQESVPRPRFTFLDDEIVFEARPLRGMGEWPWAERFSRVGVQRVEFTGPIERDDLLQFVDDLSGRLRRGSALASEARVTRPTRIRYGLVHVGEGDGDREPSPRAESVLGETVDLETEGAVVRWLEGELRDGGRLHLAEAEGVVMSLLGAMQGGSDALLPLVRLKECDQYTTTHALNVAVLAMGLAEEIGLERSRVRAIGTAGLLHDLGKVRIPRDVLNKPGLLTDSERTLIQSHTVEGARVILEHDADLDLAAIVAYEHHRRTDDGGYPHFHTPRRCHDASDLVHVCDVYDALRTHRPYREAWEHRRVMDYIAEASGTEFDPAMVMAFSAMMDRSVRLDGTFGAENDPGSS
ncbi:MAG: HD domain-containing protein [Gemmatimonadetes bacterium]|nr:HD domain-containing protein [Gemmatimonadota bacterium]